MDYSPAQLGAFARLASKRKRREALQNYDIMRSAYHADKKGDKETRKALSNGTE